MKWNLLKAMIGDRSTACIPHWEPERYGVTNSSGMEILRHFSPECSLQSADTLSLYSFWDISTLGYI